MRITNSALSSQTAYFRQSVAKIRSSYAESHWSVTRIATRVFFMTFLISAAGIEGVPEDTPFQQAFDNFVGNAATFTYFPATLYGYFKKPLRSASLAAFAARVLFGFHIGYFLSVPFSILNEAGRVSRARKCLSAELNDYQHDLKAALAHEEITPEEITQELLSLHWRFFGRWGAKMANDFILNVLEQTDLGKFDKVLSLLTESRKGRAVVRQYGWGVCHG